MIGTLYTLQLLPIFRPLCKSRKAMMVAFERPKNSHLQSWPPAHTNLLGY